MEPVGQRWPNAQRSGFAEQYEKNGLEGVFSIVFVIKKTAAHAPYQRRMTTHQRRERRFVAVDDELLEQIVVAQLYGGWIVEAAQIAQQRGKRGLSHDSDPRGPFV